MKLEIWRYDLALTHTWTIATSLAKGGTNAYTNIFVNLSSPEVPRAIGEAATAVRYNENADTIEAFLRKVDPARLSFGDIAGSMSYLDAIAAGNSSAKGAINIA